MGRLGRRLSDGELVRGVGVTTFDPAVVETAGDAGMDFVWLDFEHKGPSPSDSPTLENLARAAERTETELLVRTPTAEPWLVRRVLDAGVSNLLLPRVTSAAEVRRTTHATAFDYDGSPGGRGGAVSFASGWGREGYEPANDSPTVGVMLETAEAVEHLTEILAVPGLDFAYVGQVDLSISLGHSFETDHPEVREAINAIRTECEAANVPLGRSVSDPEAVPDAVDDGWQLLRYADEIDALRQRLAEFDANV